MFEQKYTFKHAIIFTILAVALIIASIHPLQYPDYLLHQTGTVFMLIALCYCFKKIGLNFLSFSFYTSFLIIHMVGAHYLYSYVPYNDWIKHLLGFDLNASMHWSRNMYDRLVHFAYGFLLYPFFKRLFQATFPQASAYQLCFLVIQLVMASSMLYELIEWWIAIHLSPEAAENYNGQQGDVWDAHKDMLLATIGSVVFAGIDLMLTKLVQKKA
ncbi:DUF2238 domain-containing protein [Serratia sp. S1B]|nr:DUF2238 domain-containing protein [Serratia sp. S1B]